MRREIIPIFAEPLSIVYDFLDQKFREKLINKSEEYSKKVAGKGNCVWYSGEKSPTNSFGTNTNSCVDQFKLLSTIVEGEVQNLSYSLGSNYKLKLIHSWYNIYTKDNYQEYHIHPNSYFSAVYNCKMPEGSAPLILTDFTKQAQVIPDQKDELEISDIYRDQLSVNFKENSLVVFRSHVPHKVPFGENEENRITFSFNFG